MAGVLQLICQGESLANRSSRFPNDDPLSGKSLRQAGQLGQLIAPGRQVWAAPELACRQTAQALGWAAAAVPALAEPAYGSWAGLPLKEVITDHQQAFYLWRMGEAPPGGESLLQLSERTGRWLLMQTAERGMQSAVVSPAVIRAMIIHLLAAPAGSFSLIDLLPLSVTTLRSDGKRWHLCSLGSQPHSLDDGSSA